jgi:predicted transcriptional regulator
MNPSDMQSDYNNSINEIGNPMIVYKLFTSAGAGSYNIYGDHALSGANLYISGISTTVSVQPVTEKKLDIREFGERVEGDMIAYFKSGTTLDIGYRVSGLQGDYKINRLRDWWISGILVYSVAMLDRLNK